MSTTAKVFVILLFLFSAIFLTVTAAVYSQKVNWRVKYETLNKQFDDAILSWEKRETSLNDLIKKGGDNITQLERNMNALDAQLQAAVAKATELTNAKNKVDQALDLALGVNNNLNTENGKQRDDIAQKQTKIDELTREVDGLKDDNQNLEGARLRAEEQYNTLKTSYDDLVVSHQNKVNELGKSEETVKILKDKGIPVDDIVADVAPLKRGKVMAVNAELNLVMISVGSDDGVKVGYKFYAHRGREYIAEIRIDRVEGDAAFGRVVKEGSRLPVEVGDEVTTQLNG